MATIPQAVSASWAMITGASSGIGREMAKILAREGHNLVLVARNQVQLENLKNEIQKQNARHPVVIIPGDLATEAFRQHLFSELQKQGIQLEILVNNAGVGTFGAFKEISWEKESKMIELNISALTHLCKLTLPGMVQRKSGRILNVASTAAFQPGPFMAVYFATKAYVLSLSEALAAEVQGSGVSVTALCPGPTHSGFADAAAMKETNLFNSRRLPQADEVAEFGYRRMMGGRRVAIHGTINWLGAQSVRLFPRRIVTAVTRRVLNP